MLGYNNTGTDLLERHPSYKEALKPREPTAEYIRVQQVMNASIGQSLEPTPHTPLHVSMHQQNHQLKDILHDD